MILRIALNSLISQFSAKNISHRLDTQFKTLIKSISISSGQIRGIPWLCFLCTITASLQAEIYTWEDNQGRTHFGDRPPREAQASRLELQINTYTSPEIKPLSALLPQLNRHQVVIYTSERCSVCKSAKGYLQKKKVPYKEYDIEKSQKGRRDFKRLKGTGVPILLVGRHRMNGFSATRFEAIYEAKE